MFDQSAADVRGAALSVRAAPRYATLCLSTREDPPGMRIAPERAALLALGLFRHPERHPPVAKPYILNLKTLTFLAGL